MQHLELCFEGGAELGRASPKGNPIRDSPLERTPFEPPAIRSAPALGIRHVERETERAARRRKGS